MFLAAAVFVLAAPAWSRHATSLEDQLDVDLEEEARGLKCSAQECTSFDQTKPTSKTVGWYTMCSCLDFPADDILERVKTDISYSVNLVRAVSDKVDKDSNIFKKLWQGHKLGDAQKKLHFVEAAMTHLRGSLDAGSEKLAFMDTPIALIAPSVFLVPASAYSINVEIWDHQDTHEKLVRGNTLIGQAGLSCEPKALTSVELALTKNEAYSSIDPGSAKVSVDYSVTKSEHHDCSTEGEGWQADNLKCVTITATVKCKSASNIPNIEYFGKTDPYCKVRVKSSMKEPSKKHETEHVPDNLDPTFPITEFTESWEVPMIQPVPTNTEPTTEEPSEDTFVTWTLDNMNLGEQSSTLIYYLASTVFTNKEKCAQAKFKTICKAIDSLASITIDMDALKAVEDAAAESNVKAAFFQSAFWAAVRVEPKAGEKATAYVVDSEGAAFLEEQSQRAGCMACMHHHRRGNGRTGGNGGGKGGGGGLLFLLVLVVILIICL